MNIELHGFSPEHAEKIEASIWSKLISNLSGEDYQECVVTVVDDRCLDHNARRAPFFRVISDKKADFALAADLLKPIRMPGAGIRTIVEGVLLSECIQL